MSTFKKSDFTNNDLNTLPLIVRRKIEKHCENVFKIGNYKTGKLSELWRVKWQIHSPSRCDWFITTKYLFILHIYKVKLSSSRSHSRSHSRSRSRSSSGHGQVRSGQTPTLTPKWDLRFHPPPTTPSLNQCLEKRALSKSWMYHHDETQNDQG